MRAISIHDIERVTTRKTIRYIKNANDTLKNLKKSSISLTDIQRLIVIGETIKRKLLRNDQGDLANRVTSVLEKLHTKEKSLKSQAD